MKNLASVLGRARALRAREHRQCRRHRDRRVRRGERSASCRTTTDRARCIGVRVPVSLVPLLTLEPYYAKSTGGDKDQEVGGTSFTRSGIDLTSLRRESRC